MDEQGEDHMTVQRPRFDNVFNFGQLIQALTFASSLFVFAWFQSATQAEMKTNITSLTTQQAKLEGIVTPLASGKMVQDERIANLSAAVVEMRSSNAQVLTQINAMRDDLAGIKARLQAPK